MGMGLTAIEEGDRMTEGQRRVDQVATEKNGAPENEYSHGQLSLALI
jgi:hypothetical protein